MVRTGEKLLVGVVLSFLSCSIALGQTTFGSIGGTVVDTSGAAIPAVEITLTNLGTNGKQVTASNSAGIYEFVNVLPGNYRLDAEKTAFQHFERSPLVVQVQQSYRIDIEMRVGAITQTVNVTAATPLLQPQTSSLGQVIAGRAVTEMPLNGRNVFNLMELVPGVAPQGGALVAAIPGVALSITHLTTIKSVERLPAGKGSIWMAPQRTSALSTKRVSLPRRSPFRNLR